MGEGRGGQQLGRPLVDTMKTLGAPVSVRVAGTVLVVAISASRVVSKGRSIAGLSLPLVDALGRPISVGVARSVLVVSVATSRVIGKGRGVAGLSLPLVVPEAVPVVDITVLGLIGAGQTSSEKAKTDQTDLGRPLVETVASDVVAVAVVLRGVAVAVATVVASSGTG